MALRTVEYHTAEGFPTAPALHPGDAARGFNPSWFVDDGLEAFQLAFRERVSMLTVLDLAMPLSHKQVAHLHGLLSTASCLETLKLGPVQHVPGEGDHLDSLPALHLPKLEELYIPITDDRFIAYVSTTWAMPGLRRLTTLGNKSSIPHALLAAHGTRLVYLNLYPKWPNSIHPDKKDVQRVLELCPVVEDLVLCIPQSIYHYPSEMSAFCLLSAGALRYLDNWVWGGSSLDVQNLRDP